jgi:hypothetical protein
VLAHAVPVEASLLDYLSVHAQSSARLAPRFVLLRWATPSKRSC